MRVVHISTSDLAGGAARSAFRLHKALLALGEESTMLVRNKSSTLDSVHAFSAPQDTGFVFEDIIHTWYIHRNRTSVSNTHFSLGWPGHDLSDHALVRQADILHFHWVSDFQSAPTLARLQGLGKPVVWSLHDQRPFTGGCHFSAGCHKYETDCAGCPQLEVDPAGLTVANLVDQLPLGRFSPFTVVAPSHWMAGIARRSTVFSRVRIEVIPNGVETDCFRAWPQKEARLKLGLPTEGLYLLFGADCGSEKRKGYEELVAALQGCLEDAAFRQRLERGQLGLLCFGRGSPALGGPLRPFKSFGYLDSDHTLSALYSAADLFLLPSLEDNLPNTALESLSCGTPVIGFNAGGVPDLVIEGVTGSLVPVGDHRQLGQLLLSSVSDPGRLHAMRVACRQHVERDFPLIRQAEKCRELYRELLGHPARASTSNWPPATDAGSQFRRIFPGLLQYSFKRFKATKAKRYHPVPGSENRWRRWWFLNSVRRASKAAAAGRLSHEALLVRLREELALCQAPFAERARRFLKRLFRSTR
jgi:glycosyltransferase involved in cell wall biosynthesis